MPRQHKLVAIQRIRRTDRYRAVCSCDWRSNECGDGNQAWSEWLRRHHIPAGETREANPSPKYPEVHG